LVAACKLEGLKLLEKNLNSSQSVTLDRKIAELQLDGYAQYAASSKDANLYYLTSFLADDPFLFVRTGEQSVLVISSMEKARALKSSSVDRVLTREDFQKDSRETDVDCATPNLITSVLKEFKIKLLGETHDTGAACERKSTSRRNHHFKA